MVKCSNDIGKYKGNDVIYTLSLYSNIPLSYIQISCQPPVYLCSHDDV